MSIISSLLIAGLCQIASPQAPDTLVFEEPFPVMVQNLPITVAGGFAAPAITDFDGDGLPDLLVGQREQGQLHLFLNQGERFDPEFSEGFPVQAAGANVYCPPG